MALPTSPFPAPSEPLSHALPPPSLERLQRLMAEGPGGIFPSQWIRFALEQGWLKAEVPLSDGQLQPNSLDLRLGPTGYRVQCSFLPGEEGVAQKLKRFMWYDLTLDEDGVVLERNQVYLFPLAESLNLPAFVSARANPKSSTGRLDIFTRLVTEHGSTFDEVPAGYQGRLYLEIVPRSFAVRLRPGDCLAQLRFQVGNPLLSDPDVCGLLDADVLVLSPDLKPLRSRDLKVNGGVFLSIRLDPRWENPAAEASTEATSSPLTHTSGFQPANIVGYKARKNTTPIDARARGTLPRRFFWEPIEAHSGFPIILEPDEFYIFSSRELVRLPPEICAEMVPFDAGSGELRTHYAGFFDSGFGYSGPIVEAGDSHAREQAGAGAGAEAGVCTGAQNASAVVLEIRNRDVAFLIEDGHPLFRLLLLRNLEVPETLYGAGLTSNYQGQRLKLSKQFGA